MRAPSRLDQLASVEAGSICELGTSFTLLNKLIFSVDKKLEKEREFGRAHAALRFQNDWENGLPDWDDKPVDFGVFAACVPRNRNPPRRVFTFVPNGKASISVESEEQGGLLRQNYVTGRHLENRRIPCDETNRGAAGTDSLPPTFPSLSRKRSSHAVCISKIGRTYSCDFS